MIRPVLFIPKLQPHCYYQDRVTFLNITHEYYLECAFVTNKGPVDNLKQMFYSAFKSSIDLHYNDAQVIMPNLLSLISSFTHDAHHIN